MKLRLCRAADRPRDGYYIASLKDYLLNSINYTISRPWNIFDLDL